MRAMNSAFSLDEMAKVLGVSRSGYYDFIKRPQSTRMVQNEALLKIIRTVFKESADTYGSPRIHAELIHRGFTCSARIMKDHNVQAKMHKKFRRTTKRSDHLNFKPQDRLKKNFIVNHPNTIWVTDITYLSVNKK